MSGTLKGLAKEVNQRLGVKDEMLVRKIIKVYLEIVYEKIINGEIIHFKNLFSIRKEIQRARKYNNFDNESMVKPNHFKLKFIVSKKIKKEIESQKVYIGD